MDDLHILFCTIVVVLQLSISVIGYVGNTITCIVIASSKSMYTATNVYLFNLAIADFIMLTTGIPEFTVPYWYGKNEISKELEGCGLRKTVLNTAFNVSILTITAFTIERYLAICHPFLARRILSIPKAVKCIFVIWIIGSIYGYIVGSQFMYESTGLSYKPIIMCSWTEAAPKIFNVQSIVLFILPFLLLMVLYILIWRKLAESSKIQKNQGPNKNEDGPSEIQSNDHALNKKIFKMLITVVAVFFITWAPYHFARYYKYNLDLDLLIHEVFFTQDFYYMHLSNLSYAVYSTAYFISASANPIIYSAMSKKFRDAFKEVFLKRCCEFQKQGRKTKCKQGSAETTV